MGATFIGFILGFFAWFFLRYVLTSFYTVNQDQRAIKTSFGRAIRAGKATTLDDPAVSDTLNEKDKERYEYPLLKVIPPGGPYFKWPWERVYKVSVATETMNMAKDLETPSANNNGTILEAVTKDQLNIGLTGQIRYRVSEKNIYAYLFGIKNPVVHVMGYFVAVLRQRIASFSSSDGDILDGDGIDIDEVITEISINDLRKNLNDINDYMESECRTAEGRYGIVFDASLITGIDPPQEVDSALAAINTAHNHVSSEISLAQAAADQKIVQSKRAVEIETLKAQAEVEPLLALANQLVQLKQNGDGALQAYLRNVRLGLFKKAKQVFMEVAE